MLDDYYALHARRAGAALLMRGTEGERWRAPGAPTNQFVLPRTDVDLAGTAK